MSDKQSAERGSKTPVQATTFKKGDIVWVVYRKSINWPAKVTAYYPKDKKVSYVFFPLMQKNNVFKSDPGKVVHFTLEDELPEDAKPDLEESFNQARRILEGVSEEEIIAENMRKAEEAAVSVKGRKSLTTADALKKTPKGTPKSQQKQQQHHKQQSTPAATPKAPVVFKAGDPVIVDTPMGMWPGMFMAFVDPHTVNYSLFPREDHPHEVMQAARNSILPFPPDQIQQAIDQGRTDNSEMLLTALYDVQAYLNEREAEKAQKRQSTSGTTGTPKTGAAAKASEKKPPKKATIELTPPREYKSVKKRLSRGDVENEVASTEDLPEVTPTMATGAKKRTASSLLPENAAAPPTGPMVKKRKMLEDTVAKSSSPVTKAPQHHSPVKAVMSANGSEKRMSGAERTKKLQQLGEMVEKAKRDKEVKQELKQLQQQQKAELEQQQQPVVEPKAEEEEQKQLSLSPQMHTAKAASPAITVTNAKNEELSPYELAVSDECREHLVEHLQNLGEDWFKEEVLNAEEFQLDFRSGGLFTFNELDDLVAELQKWIKLHSMQQCSPLREMYMISKHMLPEVCAHVLSKANNCTLEQAKQMYAVELQRTKIGSSSSPRMSPNQQKQNQQNNNSLNTLIAAAKMMEEGGSSEEQQQQNGTDKPLVSNGNGKM